VDQRTFTQGSDGGQSRIEFGHDRPHLFQVAGVHWLDRASYDQCPQFSVFGLIIGTLPGVGVDRDLTEKYRCFPSLMPVFLWFSDFREMRNRRIGRAAEGALMPELFLECTCCFVVP